MTAIDRVTHQLRALRKRLSGQPIRVGFFCHSPAIWGKLSPLYRLLNESPDFETLLIACPSRHESFGDMDYHDNGTSDFLQSIEQITPIKGYEETTKRWINLQELSLDYVFFQTPYDQQFPQEFWAETVSSYTKICYVPYYGSLIYRGDVEKITHYKPFFDNLSMAFLSNPSECEHVSSKFPNIRPGKGAHATGSPLNDSILQGALEDDGSWNLPRSDSRRRILWTPRWNTSEGNCHFFEYGNYFLNLAEKRNDDVDFLFRPHPLMLSNLAATGEMPLEDQTLMIKRYESLPNTSINSSGDYQNVLLTSDILVSDMSSMMAEYFLTGKPIIYTHRENSFNDFGQRLSEGFYWANDEQELDRILDELIRGIDPLKEKRARLTRELFHLPEGGASAAIAKILKSRPI